MRSRTSSQSFRRGARVALPLLAAVALLGPLAACGGSGGAASPAPTPVATYAGTVISAASLTPGKRVPAPAGKAVLTLTGKITATNKGGALVLDQPTIEKMGVEQVRLYEPWTKQTMDFRGVWLEDLLAVAGVRPEATTLHLVALDDYSADFAMADVKAGGIMLATRAGDGSAIPVSQGGPTRIVFMDGVAAGADPNEWVWSLKSIDLR